MYRLPIIRLLLTPSLFSSVASGCLTAAMLLADLWPAVRHSSLVETYLFGPYGAQTFFIQAPDRLGVLRLVLRGSLVYYLSIVVAGISVGLLVYAALQGATHAQRHIASLVRDARRHEQQRGTLYRLGLRIFCLVVWAIYTLFFVHVLVPFGLALAEAAATRWTLATAGYALAGAATLLIGLHVHVIFARLSLLRLRVFGGANLVTQYDH